MAVSRYKNLNLIDGKYTETSNPISQQDLDNIMTISIRPAITDRLDILAEKYLGNSSYWWIICYMNDLETAFDFEPGQILKIPINADDFLRLV